MARVEVGATGVVIRPPALPTPFETHRTVMPDGSVVERRYCSNRWAAYMMANQRRNRRLTPRP